MSCSFCGSEKTGRSPTGDWCNNCGHSYPCHCTSGKHEDCISYMNEIREKSGYPLSIDCCCIESLDAEIKRTKEKIKIAKVHAYGGLEDLLNFISPKNKKQYIKHNFSAALHAFNQLLDNHLHYTQLLRVAYDLIKKENSDYTHNNAVERLDCIVNQAKEKL